MTPIHMPFRIWTIAVDWMAVNRNLHEMPKDMLSLLRPWARQNGLANSIRTPLYRGLSVSIDRVIGLMKNKKLSLDRRIIESWSYDQEAAELFGDSLLDPTPCLIVLKRNGAAAKNVVFDYLLFAEALSNNQIVIVSIPPDSNQEYVNDDYMESMQSMAFIGEEVVTTQWCKTCSLENIHVISFISSVAEHLVRAAYDIGYDVKFDQPKEDMIIKGREISFPSYADKYGRTIRSTSKATAAEKKSLFARIGKNKLAAE